MKLFQMKPNPDRDTFFIPKSVQKSIPINKVYKDGIFQVSGKFSKTWRFFDVNYKVASPEKQMELFMAYCAFLNALPVNATAKITLFNRTLNQKEFSRTLLMLSIDIVPIGMDEAIKLVDKAIMSVDSDADRWQQRQNASNSFTANLPYQMEQIDLYYNNFELYDKWCIKKKTHTVMVWFVLTLLLLPFAGDLFLISKNEIIQIGCKILLISHHIFITLLSINLVNIILQTKKKARSFVSKLREVFVKWVKSTK